MTATKGRIIKRWINLDYTDPESLRADNIPYDQFRSIKDVLDDKLDQGLPIPVSRVGDLIYLPLDLKAKFNGIQIVPHTLMATCKEPDGTLVSLRMGTDGTRSFCLYDYSLTGNVNDQYITDLEYRPSFLGSSQYIADIVDCVADSGLCVEVKDTASTTTSYVWIQHNGSLDVEAIEKTVNIPLTTFLSCIYLKETDQFLVLTRDTNTLVLTLYDNTFTKITSINWFNFGDSNYCNISDYAGKGLLSFSYGPRINLNIEYRNGQYFIYSILGIAAIYPDAEFKGHIILTASLDGTDLESTLGVVNYNPTNPVTGVVYPSSGLYDYAPKLCLMDIAVLNLVGSDALSFRQLQFSTGDIATLIKSDFFHDPNLKADDTFIPTDVTVLGKKLYRAKWFGKNRIICDSLSKLASDDKLTERIIYADVDPTSRRTIFNDNDALPLPYDVGIIDDDNIKSASTFVITSAGDEYGAIIQDNNGVFKVDISTGALTPLFTLPSDFTSKVQALVSDPSYDKTYTWFYYIGPDLIAVTYMLWNSTTGDFTINLVVVKVIGTDVSLTTTTPYNIASGNDRDLDITKADHVFKSAGVFIDSATTTTYAILFTYPDVSSGNVYPIIFSYDITNDVISNHSVLAPLSIDSGASCSINYMLGPQVISPITHDAQLQITYIDETTNTVLADRLSTCFINWMNATTIPSHLFILTIETPLGYKLYLPETPVFIRGTENKLQAQTIDLTSQIPETDLSAASKCYVGLAYNGTDVDVIADLSPIKETFSQTQVAVLDLASGIVSNVQLDPQSRIDIYRPSIKPVSYGIPVSNQDGELDRGWVPFLLEAKDYQYNSANTVSNETRKYQRICGGVVQLIEVTATQYHAVITFPLEFRQYTSPPLVFASLTNTADGYTGSGGIDSINTWVRFETANISTEGCTLVANFGADVSGLTIFAHWIAIGPVEV